MVASGMHNNKLFTFKKILYFELILWIFLPILISNFNFPRTSLYVIDAVNIIIFLHTLPKFLSSSKRMFFVSIMFTILAIALVGLVGLPEHGERFILYIWGLRNVLRYFIFLINCITEFNSKDISRIMNRLEGAMYLSVPISLYQFFIKHLSGDFLGGIFGTGTGVNGYLVVLLTVVQTNVISKFLTGSVSINRFIASSGSILLIAVLAELKIMFILYAIEIIIGVSISKPSKRISITIGIATLIAILSIRLLSVLNPNSYSYFSSWENFTFYLNNSYSLNGGFSRTNAIERITNLFFHNRILNILFGYGLGQCDYAGIESLNSSFYQVNGWLNYRLFFHAMTYVEMGVVGLVTYALFYLNILISTIKYRHRLNPDKFIFNVLIIIMIFIVSTYNYTLRSDPGYLWMFAIAASMVYAGEMGAVSKRYLTKGETLNDS